MDHKCLQVLLLINMCITLCVALPLSYRQPGESANLFKKLFPGEESSIPDDWSKSERSMFVPSEDRSKFQSFHDEELRENLLRDILDWNKRRMEQVQQSDATNEKREPHRCSASFPRCHEGDESTKEDESRRVLALGNREPGHVQISKMADIMKMKEYDMELEKALRNLENDRPDILSSQM